MAVASTCAWCTKRLSKGAQMDQTVTAIVPAANSQAKRDGFDLLSAVSSPTCGETRREILIRRVHGIDQVYRGDSDE